MMAQRDVTWDILEQGRLEEVQRLIDRALAGFTRSGRLNLSAQGTTGTLPKGAGGTGNKSGEATPLDGSVTDAKVAAGADIDPGKLDQALLLALAYTLVKGFLQHTADVTITPNDVAHTLTIGIIAPERTLDSLSDVEITDAQAGDMLMAFESGGVITWRNVHGVPATEGGALYVGGQYLTVGGQTLTVGG